ncbi:hypothetical protein F4811DRAFT_523268 [Daldinia bambusicola]|nr:hypothetical protein F4811DRAFT_523268 [Daldinia bambusicola]
MRQAHQSNEKISLSDVHHRPPRPRARRQDRDKSGLRSLPLSIQHPPTRGRHPCGQGESKEQGGAKASVLPYKIFTLGRRGYHSSTRVGSVAPLGNTE